MLNAHSCLKPIIPCITLHIASIASYILNKLHPFPLFLLSGRDSSTTFFWGSFLVIPCHPLTSRCFYLKFIYYFCRRPAGSIRATKRDSTIQHYTVKTTRTPATVSSKVRHRGRKHETWMWHQLSWRAVRRAYDKMAQAGHRSTDIHPAEPITSSHR